MNLFGGLAIIPSENIGAFDLAIKSGNSLYVSIQMARSLKEADSDELKRLCSILRMIEIPDPIWFDTEKWLS